MPLYPKKISIWGVLFNLAKRPVGRPPKERDGADRYSKHGGFWRGKNYYTRPGYGEPKEKK